MKKLIGTCNHNFILTASILFISTIFFTLDSFCYNTITTAFDIINIAGIRLEAMDFVYILFTFTCAMGMTLGFVLKKYSKIFTSIMSMLSGLLLFIVALLDVDLMQTLLPTMRISHVIMTLSQIIIIILGACGLMIGANLAHVINSKQKIDFRIALIALCIGVSMAILAISEHLYTLVYSAVALFIIFGTIVFQYNKQPSISSVEPAKKGKRLDSHGAIAICGNASIAAALALIIGTMYNYLVNTVKMSIIGYIIIIAATITLFILGKCHNISNILKIAIWSITAIFAITACFVQTAIIACLTLCLLGFSLGVCWTSHRYTCIGSITACSTIAVFSIISLVIIKLLSQEVKHSGNRIYYKVNASVFAIIFSLMLVGVIIKVVGHFLESKNIIRRAIDSNELTIAI